MDRKKHWEDIYRTKESKELSWYQPVPSISLDFIKELNVAKYAKIIYRAIYYLRGPTVFFFLDKILSIDNIDILFLHGSLQCVVIQKFSLNVVQSSKFIQVLILTKNRHFSSLVLIYGITTMKSM